MGFRRQPKLAFSIGNGVTMNSEMVETSLYSLAGLGKAPFKLMGIAELPSKGLLEANPTAYHNAMKDLPRGYRLGSCALCNTGISVNYLVDSSCGRKHAIGCECIQKIGSTKLTSDAHEMKLARDRSRRYSKREAEREERNAKILAQLDAERAANNGETNKERDERLKIELRDAALNPILSEIYTTLELLEASGSDFALSISRSLRSGVCPSTSGIAIASEIATKQATGTRKGTKMYKDTYPMIRACLDEACIKIAAIDDI